MGFWKRKPHDPLDELLFRWPDGLPFTIRDVMRSVEVKGISGSGKTSGAYQHFLDKLLGHPRSTLAIVTQKPEEREQVVEAFRRRKRLDKLVIIEEGGKLKCNFLEDEFLSGADTASLTELVTVIGQGMKAQESDPNPFYKDAERRCIYNAIGALGMGGKVTFPNLQEFIVDAIPPLGRSDPETAKRAMEEWRKRLHYRVMMTAAAKTKTPMQASDWKVFADYWSKEWLLGDERTRGNIIAGCMNVTHAATTGLAREMTGTVNNVSPRMIDDGYSFLIHLPFSVYGPTGRFVAGGLKYKIQRHILKRKWNPTGYFNVLLLDEYQESCTDFDATYLSQCRSHGGCMLALTQTVHAEFGRMGGHAGHHRVSQLQSNFGTHYYFLSDPATAKAASELLGMRREIFITASIPGGDEPWDMIFGRSKASASVSEQYQPILQPSVLQSRLRTGGPENDYCVDSVAVRPGHPFKSGENYQFVTFKQR